MLKKMKKKSEDIHQSSGWIDRLTTVGIQISPTPGHMFLYGGGVGDFWPPSTYGEEIKLSNYTAYIKSGQFESYQSSATVLNMIRKSVNR